MKYRDTKQMLVDGVIHHSTSLWNSPLLVVPKKIDAYCKMKWRVVDFHKLKDVTIGDSFPFSVISDYLTHWEIQNVFQLSIVLVDFGKFW